MERLNISFPPETREQLEALARLSGGNISEAVRVAVQRDWERQFRPGSAAPDALLERLDLLVMQMRSALQGEFERRAEAGDPTEDTIATLRRQLGRNDMPYAERLALFQQIDAFHEEAETFLCEAPDYPGQQE